MTPDAHKARAEALLAEGVAVVQRISAVAERRQRLIDYRQQWNADAFAAMEAAATREMDELGKKAMGIWAQAHVHATLATIPLQQVQVEVLDTVSVEVANAGDLR